MVGDLVTFYADVIKVGRTSITVSVEVYAQRNPEKEETVKVTEAVLTYVAVDNQAASACCIAATVNGFACIPRG